MKPKTIEEIQDEVVKEFITHAPFSTREWRFISGQTQLRLWPEICKRYAIEVTKPISELLAVMHGDGGHYQEKHGLAKAIEDAMELLHTKWKSPDQVKDECFKVAKASLEKASERGRVEYKGNMFADPSTSTVLYHPDGSEFSIDKSSITSHSFMNKLQHHSNEFYLLRGFPEKPEHDLNIQSPADFKRKLIKYKHDFEACIAAKTRVDNPEIMEIGNLLSPFTHLFNKAKDGIFDLPDNVEFEEINICDIASCISPTCQNKKECQLPEKVIHLKLKQEVKPIETQDELWSKVINATDDVMRTPQEFERCRQYLKSKFKIQRIHPEQ